MRCRSHWYRVTFAVMVSLILVGRSPVRAQSADEVRLTFEEIGYADLTLNGLYGENSLRMPIPSNWILNDPITLDLNYVASPLLLQDRATLTVMANGKLVSSLQPVADGQPQTITLTVPAEIPLEQDLALEFKGFLMISEDSCTGADNPGQWLTVLKNSALTMTPALDTSAPTLGSLPQSIMVQNAIGDPPPVIFVLPDSPDSTALTAAARVASRLGRETSGQLQSIQAETKATLTEDQQKASNLVLVGLPEALPVVSDIANRLPSRLGSSGFLTADGSAAPPEHGVVQILNSPFTSEHKVLLVSAGNAAGLTLVGQGFSDSQTFQSMQGPFTFVRTVEPVSPSGRAGAWLGPSSTLAQLGYPSDREVVGLGTVDVHYTLYPPVGWVFGSGAKLNLTFVSSPALNLEESHVSVFVNEQIVGTTPANPNPGEPVQVSFNIPASALNKQPEGEYPRRQIDLTLSVGNFINQRTCELIPGDAAWTTISGETSLETPHAYIPLPDLQAFPYPFISDEVDAPPLAIILPVQPTNAEIGHGLSLAEAIGRSASQDFEIELVTADSATQEALGNSNLIVIGGQGRQPLLEEFQAAIGPAPDPAVYKSLDNQGAAILHEGVSAWNSKRTVLLVYGETDQSIADAVTSLHNAPPVSESGAFATVQRGQSPQIIPLPGGAASVLANGQVPADAAGGSAGQASASSLSPFIVLVTAIVGGAIAIVGALAWRRRQKSAFPGAPATGVAPFVPPATSSVAPPVVRVADRPASLLIIEDDRPTSRLLQKHLSLAGYSIRSADNPILGLQMAEAEVPDLIILDVMMPEMNGFQVAERLRRMPGLARVPILFLSALMTTSHKAMGFDSGGDDYMTKPYEPEELELHVAALLRRSRMGTADAPGQPTGTLSAFDAPRQAGDGIQIEEDDGHDEVL